jgi:hypothetical protein
VHYEIETASLENRRRLHVESGLRSIDSLARARKATRVPGNIVDDDQFGAGRANAPGEALTFHACPEYRDSTTSERRDTSYQRHAAIVHRPPDDRSGSGERQGSVAAFTAKQSGSEGWQP